MSVGAEEEGPEGKREKLEWRSTVSGSTPSPFTREILTGFCRNGVENGRSRDRRQRKETMTEALFTLTPTISHSFLRKRYFFTANKSLWNSCFRSILYAGKQ